MSDILTKNQIAVLTTVGGERFLAERFYLSGGTALAAFYLHHRYSEDLDFFSENEVPLLELDVFIKKLKDTLSVTRVDFAQSYNRNLFFLHFRDGEVLKTEFTYFPFPRIQEGERAHGIILDSVLDIAVNKVFTIYQRTAARDYVDLYALCTHKGYSIQELVGKARAKFDWHIDPLQLGTQFIKAEEAQDYPRLIAPIARKEVTEFFKNEAQKLRPEILS